jgi:hypothetical protein
MKKFKIFLPLLLALGLTSCGGAAAKSSHTGQNDVMIHQLRVELEEMKHHIHTTVMQMNILTNKMVNSEDTIFELKQRDLIVQKQQLEKQQEKLLILEKKVDSFAEIEQERKISFDKIAEEVKIQSRSALQNKKKIHELEKNALSLQPLTERQNLQ